MQVDKTTLTDLSIFHHEEELSVFHHLNFTRTNGGKDWLRILLSRPLQNLQQIEETQSLIRILTSIHSQWPEQISNGTVMVIEKFYDTALEEMPAHPNAVNSFFYKLINGPDFSLVKYSVEHFVHFIKGLHNIAALLRSHELPAPARVMLERMDMLIAKAAQTGVLNIARPAQLRRAETLRLGRFFRRHFKHEAVELVDIHSRLDAYYSLATACLKHQLVFPRFTDSETPFMEARALYHLLLPNPVAYDVELPVRKNFLFLTGANMAGKSTFIKATGVAVYLAHLGMAVPARELTLSYFDGLLSNIQVTDNLLKGESYFFNEVQRIRKTIEKISDGKKWLILIDELFKGTNVQDAMKCSTAVIEGLRKMQNALFILSTHLYEIGEDLKRFPNIQFRFFETRVEEDQLVFNYRLQEGISNDRLGYVILKREGVVKLLENL